MLFLPTDRAKVEATFLDLSLYLSCFVFMLFVVFVLWVRILSRFCSITLLLIVHLTTLWHDINSFKVPWLPEYVASCSGDS